MIPNLSCRSIAIVLGLLLVSLTQAAQAQFRDRPDPLRDAAADVLRREAWHQEMRRLEVEEERTKNWAAARQAELKSGKSRLEDRVRMNKVLLQQFQVAGAEEKAEQLREKVEGEVRGFQEQQRAFEREFKQRMTEIAQRREQLQREFRGEPDRDRPREELSKQEHLQAAVRHLAEAAQHFERIGMRRQAEAINEQLKAIERELREERDQHSPPREQRDTERLIDAIERLNERMERMEKKLNDMQEGDE